MARKALPPAALELWLALIDNKAGYGFPNVYPIIMMAQSALETGYWTSPLWTGAKNGFGMSFPTHRLTTAVTHTAAEGGNAFAVYDSYTDSAIDYLIRQQLFHIADEPTDGYINSTVASGYAADPDYAAKWAAAALKLNDEYEIPVDPRTGESSSLWPLALLGGVILLARK